ncbi:MAG: hypothetical protein J5372_05990 [Lachnospiraceae bacterium]|nr:hypothetical protein [Lachnospiraceae bacterium]
MKTWKNAEVVVLNIGETANGDFNVYQEIKSDGTLYGYVQEAATWQCALPQNQQQATTEYGKEEATTGARS